MKNIFLSHNYNNIYVNLTPILIESDFIGPVFLFHVELNIAYNNQLNLKNNTKPKYIYIFLKLTNH